MEWVEEQSGKAAATSTSSGRRKGVCCLVPVDHGETFKANLNCFSRDRRGLVCSARFLQSRGLLSALSESPRAKGSGIIDFEKQRVAWETVRKSRAADESGQRCVP